MTITATTLIDLLTDAGYEPAEYSGRGMNGKQCISIRTEERMLLALSDIIGCADDVDHAAEILRAARTDQLGVGLVIYWPLAKWPTKQEQPA